MRKLEDIADVTVGQIMARVTENLEPGDNTVMVLNPKAINAGCINDALITRVSINKKIDDSKYTKAGDIVVKLSTPYEGVLIDQDHEGLLISSFCAIIRTKENKKSLDMGFLCAALNSEYVRDQISKKVAGTVNPMVKVTDLRSVMLPNVDEKEMYQLGEEYLLSCRKRFLLSKLEENEKELMDARIMNCLCKETSNNEGT